jgi:ribosomal protein S18 acetylase RimI-like enzyme
MRANLNSLKKRDQDVQGVSCFSIPELGQLLLESYFGTTDWEDGATFEDASSEIRKSLDDEYGDFSGLASGVIVGASNKPVSSVFCSIYEDEPFVIFSFTHPSEAGKGFASRLIKNAAASFYESGFETLHLYVTDTNPALNLYQSLGFKVINSGL